MRTNFFALLCFVLGFLMLSRLAWAQDTKAFDHYFRKTGEIHLSESVLVGTIDHIDINEKGHLLITDRRAHDVYLFDQQGNWLKTLDTEACNPELSWSPKKASYGPDDTIVVLNGNYPRGVVFSDQGACQYVVDASFQDPHFLCKNQQDLYGFYADDIDHPHIKKLTLTGKGASKLTNVSGEFAQINRRIPHGGLVCDTNTLYLAMASGPEVYKFSRSGQLLSTFNQAPSYHKRIKKDVPATLGLPQLMKAFREVDNKSITLSMDRLMDGILMIQFITGSAKPNPIGIQFLDVRTGNLANKREVVVKRPFLFAKNGYAYAVKYPELEENGMLPNAYLEVYQVTLDR